MEELFGQSLTFEDGEGDHHRLDGAAAVREVNQAPAPAPPPQQAISLADAQGRGEAAGEATNVMPAEEDPDPYVDDEDWDDDEELLSQDGGHEDFESHRMALSEDERQWALRIKELIQSTPELASPPLSDMMIAQIALISVHDEEEGDMDKVRERVLQLQCIQRDYEVVESLASAKAILSRVVQDLIPGFFLSLYFHPGDHCYTLVVDLTKFDMTFLSDPDKVLIWLKGIYYINHCQNPDLASVRMGITYLCECEGFVWKANNMVQVKAYQEWGELAHAYPLHYKSLKHFHCGMFLTILTSMGKRFLPSRMAKKFEFGLVSEHGRLDRLYLTPSLREANQRLLNRFFEVLELRYRNEASFTL